jgi:hypothetical protein
MISVAQLQNLEFEYEEVLETWSYKDILVYFSESDIYLIGDSSYINFWNNVKLEIEKL